MSDIQQRKADRLRVMAAIYRQVGANEHTTVQMFEIQKNLGFSDEYMGSIASYLAGEGLIAPIKLSTGTFTPMLAHITHLGVKEMELAEERPDKPTEHFPAAVNIVVHGNMVGSSIHSASPGASHRSGDISVGSGLKKAITEFVAAFEAKAAELVEQGEQTQADVDRMLPDVTTMKVQASSSEPRQGFIEACRDSVKAILENGTGGVLTVGLINLLHLIH